jgi:DNA-binding CsgD family transcriptional regulator
MRYGAEHHAAGARAIEAAPFEGGWKTALRALAEATDAWVGQLVAVGPGGRLELNVVDGISDDLNAEFERRRGGDPAVNPRVAAVMGAAPMRVVTEADAVTPEATVRHPLYQELFLPADAVYACMAKLVETPDLTVAVATLRGASRGHVEAEEARAFAALLPSLVGAMALQRAADLSAAGTSARAFDLVDAPVFFCDGSARLACASAAGEALLAREGWLTLRERRLGARGDVADRDLKAAICRAADRHVPGASRYSSLVGQGSDGWRRVVVGPAPENPLGLNLGACVMVAVAALDARSRALLLRRRGLSEGEIEIAGLLVQGLTPAQIADRRGTSIWTVRTQVKTLYAKLGVSGVTQLQGAYWSGE